MPRKPRWFRGEKAYAEVQRTVDRQLLFKPDPVVMNIIGSAAARAKARYPVKLFWLDCNINHKQTGRAPLSDDPEHLENMWRFDQLFNSLVTRGVNDYFGREGGLYSSRNRSKEAVDDPALEQQLLYAVTNPVKDGLVERVAHWQSAGGVSSYRQLATGEVDRYTYVDRTAWHRAGGERSRKRPEAFTKTVELVLDPLPGWEGMPAGRRQALFRRLVRQWEQDAREEREREGRRVMGRRRLARVDPRSRPMTRKPKTRAPVCHASSIEARDEYRQQQRVFLEQYYYASGMYLAGNRHVEFPRGSFRPPLLGVCA
jgi:hypothetical protein